MKLLKEAFEQSGFIDVATYINSGNILFSAEGKSEAELKTRCEKAILNKFGIGIPVLVMSAQSFIEASQNAPDWWGNEPDTKHNAIFVLPPFTPEEVIREVGEAKPEYEKIGYSGNIIFWSAPIKTFSRT